jgi:exosortase family protein XrtM
MSVKHVNRVPGRNWHSFVRAYRQEVGFVVRFFMIFLAVNLLYFLLPDRFMEEVIFSRLTARPVAAIVQFFSPADNMVAERTLLTSKHGSLMVTVGCEGAQSILILVSALLAYSLPVKRKLAGVICGVLFMYCMNIGRIVGVYYVTRYNPRALDIAHLYVGQTFVILMMFLFFIFWVRRSLLANEQKRTG